MIDGVDANFTWGIAVQNSTALTNVTVKNLKVTDWSTGIIYINAANGKITNNTVSSNQNTGIYFSSSSNNTLTNNKMIGNRQNFVLFGSQDLHFNNSIDTSNTVDSKSIYYIKNAANTVYDSSSNAGTLYCIWCSNVTIKDLTLINNYYGIFFRKTSNSKIENINSSSNNNGIYLESSHYNTLSNNTANSNSFGIELSSSSFNTLSSNTANSNLYGIELVNSFQNTLSNNTIRLNSYGIHPYSGNVLYRNNLINNINNAYDDIGGNRWDDGYPTGGNFWSDYTGIDSNNDGIGDTLYNIGGGVGAKDNYPFMQANGWLNYSPDTTPPTSITNLFNISYAQTYINWTWTDPSDPDFSKVTIYLNGGIHTNVTKGVRYYNATGLTPNMTYTVSTRTVDVVGNVNSTWVNHTATTATAFNNASVSYGNIGYSAIVAIGQNTFVQNSVGTFGLLLKGQSKTINNSVILNNTGDISARVEARFNDSIAGVFGLISGANVLNATNFALGLPSALVPLNNSGANVQVAVAPPGVTALDARLGVPNEQAAGDYSGTVVLTFSNNV